MKLFRKTTDTMKKGVLLLFAGILVFGQFSVSSVQAEEKVVTLDLYGSVVSKAGNYEMKQLGESIRSDAANAQVVTSDPGDVDGNIYYISVDGNAGNDGLSAASPWPIEKVNETTFQPGDHILFKAGDSWELTESVHPKGSGTEDNRIVIGAYGSGAKPKLSAKNIGIPWTFTDGSTRYASDVIYLENQQYIEIRDLDISNKPDGYTGQQSTDQAAMRKDRRGIHIVGGNNTTQTELKGFWLHDLYVHDVVGEANGVSGTGWDPSKRTAGIFFEIIVKGENGLPVIANPVDVTGFEPTWFADVTIEKNVLMDNSFGGIIVKQLQAWGARQDTGGAPSYDYDGWYPNTNFTIQDNYLDHDGSEYAADTIYLTCTNDSVIRHNVSRGAGTSAIELYFTDRITVEWNEVFRARQKPTGADSNAIDPDKASTNALIQYNYLHENGDGILLCGFIYGSSVVRYNVIKDSESGKRYLNVHGDKGHNYIYNNIFYNSRTTAATFVSTSGDKDRYLNDTNNFHYFSNNIFYSPNNASARTDDGIAVIYSNNSYYNVSAVPAEDTGAIVGDPKFKNPTGITGGIGKDVDLAGLELQADSPLISAGKLITSHPYTTIPVGTITDFAGNLISAGGVDLGVFEYIGEDASVGDLRGYTFDPYGDIKAGATVKVNDITNSQDYTVTSDERGFYSISGIPAGAQLSASVEFEDYEASNPLTAEIFGADVSFLNLTLGASTLTTGAISGTVTNGAGATIKVTDSNGQVLVTTKAAADGTYIISDIPIGEGYTVTVQKENYQDGTQSGITVQAAYTTKVDFVISRSPTELKYLLKENFDYEAGPFASNDVWNVTNVGGTAEVVKDETGNSYLRVAKDSSTTSLNVINKNPVGAADVFTIEYRIKRTDVSGSNQSGIYTGETETGSTSTPMADVGFYNNYVYIHAARGSGTTTNYSATSNRWYAIKMVVNMDTDTFDFYIDGVLKKTDAQLRTVGDVMNYFRIFSGTDRDLMVDYLWVYEGIPAEDDADVTSVTVEELGDGALLYDSDTKTFTSALQVPYQYDSIKIHVAPSSPFAEVVLNGTNLGRIDDNAYVAVPLTTGENTVQFTVTAADGSAETYTIVLKRQDESILAYLTALELSGLTLTPEFEGTEPEESEVVYSAGTTSEAEHTLAYTTATSGSSVSIAHNGRTLAAGSPVALTLVEGLNTIVIVVSSESGDEFKTYTVTVTLETAPPEVVEVTGVSVAPTVLTMAEGGASQLTAIIEPVNATNKAVSWSSSDTAVAEVSADGLVTAKQAGTAVITVTTVDGSFTAEVQVTVEAAPPGTTTSYRLSGPGSVQTGETFQVIYGLSNVTEDVYAKSVTIHYDPSFLEYVGESSLIEGFTVVGSTYGPGTVRIIEAAAGSAPIRGTLDLLTLTFKALGEAGSTQVYLTDIVLGNRDGIEQRVESGNPFLFSIVDPAPAADKTELAAVIVQAAFAVENAKVLDPEAPRYGYYPQSAIDAITDAIAAAQGVYDQSNATQAQVDEATGALSQALAQFLTSASQTAGIGDLAIMAANYGATSNDANWQSLRIYDFNDDGKLDLFDLVSMAQRILN